MHWAVETFWFYCTFVHSPAFFLSSSHTHKCVLALCCWPPIASPFVMPPLPPPPHFYSTLKWNEEEAAATKQKNVYMIWLLLKIIFAYWNTFWYSRMSLHSHIANAHNYTCPGSPNAHFCTIRARAIRFVSAFYFLQFVFRLLLFGYWCRAAAAAVFIYFGAILYPTQTPNWKERSRHGPE